MSKPLTDTFLTDTFSFAPFLSFPFRVGSDSDRRPTSAQFLKAFKDENFACVSLPRGLVILLVFAVTAGAFESN
jgi:hypothetical protein